MNQRRRDDVLTRERRLPRSPGRSDVGIEAINVTHNALTAGCCRNVPAVRLIMLEEAPQEANSLVRLIWRERHHATCRPTLFLGVDGLDRKKFALMTPHLAESAVIRK